MEEPEEAINIASPCLDVFGFVSGRDDGQSTLALLRFYRVLLGMAIFVCYKLSNSTY